MRRWGRSRQLGVWWFLLGLVLILAVAIVGCDNAQFDETSEDLSISPAIDLRIDGHDADLAPISWFGVSPRGLIAISQVQDGNIRFFDANGRDLGTVGRSGSGPGEFQRPRRGGWLADTLWISDVQLNRITLISPAPELLRTLPPLVATTPGPENKEQLSPFIVQPYGLYSDTVVLALGVGSPDGSLGEALRGPPLMRVDSSGHVEHMVLRIPENRGNVIFGVNGGFGQVVVPFFPRPEWAVSPDGSRIATVTTAISGPEGGSYRVALYDAEDGREVFSREYAFEGEPIPRQAVDSVVALYERSITEPEMRRAFENDVKSRIPSVYPPVSSIFVGMDQRVWIGLRTTEGRNPWVVLGGSGEPVSRVTVPGNVTLQVAEDGHVWGIERDEVDVESVVRYALTGSN